MLDHETALDKFSKGKSDVIVGDKSDFPHERVGEVPEVNEGRGV